MLRMIFHGMIFMALPGGALAQAPPAGSQPDKPAFKVEVIGTTPLPGVDLLLEEIPAPVEDPSLLQELDLLIVGERVEPLECSLVLLAVGVDDAHETPRFRECSRSVGRAQEYTRAS